MSNSGDDQEFSNVKKWLFLDSNYTVDIIFKTNTGIAKVDQQVYL